MYQSLRKAAHEVHEACKELELEAPTSTFENSRLYMEIDLRHASDYESSKWQIRIMFKDAELDSSYYATFLYTDEYGPKTDEWRGRAVENMKLEEIRPTIIELCLLWNVLKPEVSARFEKEIKAMRGARLGHDLGISESKGNHHKEIRVARNDSQINEERIQAPTQYVIGRIYKATGYKLSNVPGGGSSRQPRSVNIKSQPRYFIAVPRPEKEDFIRPLFQEIINKKIDDEVVEIALAEWDRVDSLTDAEEAKILPSHRGSFLGKELNIIESFEAFVEHINYKNTVYDRDYVDLSVDHVWQSHCFNLEMAKKVGFSEVKKTPIGYFANNRDLGIKFDFRDEENGPEGVWMNDKYFDFYWHGYIVYNVGVFLHPTGWFDGDPKLINDPLIKNAPNWNGSMAKLAKSQLSHLIDLGFKQIVDFKKEFHQRRGANLIRDLSSDLTD